MRNINLRINIVFIFFSFLFVAIFLKITYLQLFRTKFFKKLADSQHVTVIPLGGERGSIYDREGRVLATNIDVYSVYASPHLIGDKEEIVEKLTNILNIEKNRLIEKLSSSRKFVWLKRKITWEEKAKLEKLSLEGIGFLREKKRFYPQGVIASHILGGVDIDNKGIESVELFYDQYLRGKQGFVTGFKDASSYSLIFYPQVLNPQEGADIFLTIDAQIQYWAETFLKETIDNFGAKAGSVVVVDPFNGEILALANWPTFDPNNIGGFPPENRRNRAITDAFEPGSVFKIVTLTAAVAEKKSWGRETIFCEEGKYKIPGGILHDWKPYGELSFEDVFKKSSNIGVAKIASQLGKDTIYKYIKKFGFGKKTNVDLPGEILGIIKKPQDWSRTSLYIIPIGQEVSVNLLQLVQAMSVIVNGGYLVKPHVVKKILHKNFLFEPRVERKRVMSGETTEEVKRILVKVVNEGTGKRAQIEDVVVGGKTGTAQKFDLKLRRYSQTKYRASFLGFLNKDGICLVIGVSIDEPKKSHFGGVVAAPLFKRLGEKTLRYLEYKSALASVP